MKEFQIMRYLQRWWYAIAILSALSGIVFYLFISSRQTYQAKTMLEFTNEGAAEGLYPSGDSIDIQEIRSSSVIYNAMESIGSSASVDQIRGRINITASISEQDEAIQAAKWAEGETYDFFPTKYIITYKSDRGESSTDARRILEAIVDSYITLYSEKYVSITKVPNSVASLQNLNYDYTEWAEVIDDFISLDRNYLQTMKNSSKNFRSSTTGYSFQDLYNEYTLIYDVYLPSLYSLILDNHVTIDRNILIDRYQYHMSQNALAITNYEEALALVDEMIENYTNKIHDTMNYHWGESEAENATGNSYVIGQVYDFEVNENYDPEQTTYDSVLERYVELRSNIASKRLDNNYCQFILDAFTNSDDIGDQMETEQVAALIAMIEKRLEVLDSYLTATAAEHSEVETIRNVRVRSTVNVKEVTNVKLYTMMIVAVFFIFGVTGAVVVGRGSDFIDYHFYTDPSTDLPNRMRCDMEIEKYSKKLLSFPFTCVVVNLANMKEINDESGRAAGNEALRIFANFINECAENYGFAGYNGSLQFICLFPDCDVKHATYYKNTLQRMIGEFNKGGHGIVIRYKIAAVTADENTPYTMRELLSATMQQHRKESVVIAEEQELS